MNAKASSANGTGHQTIFVAGLSRVFQEVMVPSEAPTGAQIAVAAGLEPRQNTNVLELMSDGELEDIHLDEVVGLSDSTRKFLVVLTDRVFNLKVNGTVYEWPTQVITGGQIRKLGHVSVGQELFRNPSNGIEQIVHNHDLVDLAAPGDEVFNTRPCVWKLNVQGVLLKLSHPSIVVRQAIEDAGFDPNKPWIIVLRVHGEPKREVDLNYVIDLCLPGVEKLRLIPKDVNNGEAPSAPRRLFDLLVPDEHFLNNLSLRWETIIETVAPNQQRRWLLVHNYPVPAGFTVDYTVLALEIPPTYPGAQIYGFYTNPPLALKSGRTIPSTQLSAEILGVTFNGWSRHRGRQFPWNPTIDNVATHMALVDAAMAKEVGE